MIAEVPRRLGEGDDRADRGADAGKADQQCGNGGKSGVREVGEIGEHGLIFR